MSPELWRQARQIFEDALDQEPAAREAFVRASCKDDKRLFEEVASMLASYDTADDVFLNPVIQGVKQSDRLEGRQLGPYRILHRLGQGGMGAVYLAERADDQFRRRAAVKLVRPGYDDGHLMRRFSNERQLLAVLDHPNIVKLLDAGVTDDGIPYLVMDYVEGQPIDKYCETRGLSIPEKLALFREVCAAVHCAHRNLVVHRDLKPSNILVTPDGTPKLLDFGIAKLLRPEYGAGAIGLTRTMQPMTPEFASPEQVTGQPITTSSDVYSLGVLLYRLIAGKHPYEMNTSSAAEVERTICETNPERPSAVAKAKAGRKRGVSSDLDNIVLMAMRKEPQRRYPSAEHLSEDIRRYLGNQPVTARKDTLLYRASKFVSRNRYGVAAAAVAVIAMFASITYAGNQKLRAAGERGKAEARLAQLQHSQHFMLFELDDKLRESVTLGRKLLVTEATKQINILAEEAGGDEKLLVEAAKGYHKIGDLQGNPLVPNLAEYQEARESYLKSLQLGQRIKPGPTANSIISNAHIGLGRLDGFFGRKEEAENHFRAAIEAASDPEAARRSGMSFMEQLGQLQENRGDLAAAIQYYSKSLDRARELERIKPTEIRKANVLNESLLLGGALAKAGRSEESLKQLRESLAIAHALAAGKPARRRNEASAYGYLGYALALAGQTSEAVDAYEHSCGIFARLAAEDPKNQQARIDLGEMKGELAGVLWSANRRKDAARATDEALEILKPALSQPDTIATFLREYATFLLAESNTRPDPAAAMDSVQRADVQEHHSNPETLETLAAAYFASGNPDRAKETAREALALMPAGGNVYVRKKLEAWLAGAPKSTPR